MLPADTDTAGVEPRLVADHATLDVFDAGARDLVRKRPHFGRGESRVAVALEDDVAPPRRAALRPIAEHVRLDPE